MSRRDWSFYALLLGLVALAWAIGRCGYWVGPQPEPLSLGAPTCEEMHEQIAEDIADLQTRVTHALDLGQVAERTAEQSDKLVLDVVCLLRGASSRTHLLAGQWKWQTANAPTDKQCKQAYGKDVYRGLRK